jgi:hypothetical protein
VDDGVAQRGTNSQAWRTPVCQSHCAGGEQGKEGPVGPPAVASSGKERTTEQRTKRRKRRGHEQGALNRQTNWRNRTKIVHTMFCCVRLPVAAQIHPSAVVLRSFCLSVLPFSCRIMRYISEILAKIQLHVKKNIQRMASQGRPTCVPDGHKGSNATRTEKKI